MKKLACILYIFILGFIAGSLPQATQAAVACQVIYGGGQVCQGQAAVKYSYPPSQQPQITATPTPTPPAVPRTNSLPATGTSTWGLLLLGLSGIGGIVILLL